MNPTISFDHQVSKFGFWSAVVAMVVLVSVVAFIIPKFIAVWTIPLLAETISNSAVGADVADPFLRLLNVSLIFTLHFF